MWLKAFLLTISCAVALGAPIIYNQPYNNRNVYQTTGGYLTPPRAITTLNTYIPRQLIPPAPPRAPIPRVFDNQPSRIYTAPPIFRPIPPAPTTRRPFPGNPNNVRGYAFNYGVNDNRTGDIKNVQEQSDNGVVTGSYSLREPDGAVRTVTYTADDVSGFNAVVSRTNTATNNQPLVNNSPFTIFT